MATNFFELGTTLKNLGAKWLSGKKSISCPALMLETILFLKINRSVEEEKASNNRPRNGNEFEDTWS